VVGAAVLAAVSMATTAFAAGIAVSTDEPSEDTLGMATAGVGTACTVLSAGAADTAAATIARADGTNAGALGRSFFAAGTPDLTGTRDVVTLLSGVTVPVAGAALTPPMLCDDVRFTAATTAVGPCGVTGACVVRGTVEIPPAVELETGGRGRLMVTLLGVATAAARDASA